MIRLWTYWEHSSLECGLIHQTAENSFESALAAALQ